MTIKYKNTSYRSNTLLDNLIKVKRLWFDINTAYRLLPDSNPDAVKKLLSDMTKRGLLMRVKERIFWLKKARFFRRKLHENRIQKNCMDGLELRIYENKISILQIC
jgi:predicted transcriptional regulator of viral defense system